MVDLTVEFSVLEDDVVRPTTIVALLLTLAFIREAGSAGMDERVLVLNGEEGRELGLDRGWRVTTLLGFTLAVTFPLSIEVQNSREAREARHDSVQERNGELQWQLVIFLF